MREGSEGGRWGREKKSERGERGGKKRRQSMNSKLHEYMYLLLAATVLFLGQPSVRT